MVLLGLTGFLSTPAANAADLALVIDDIGHSKSRGLRTLALPGQFTIAVLPFAPFTRSLVEAAEAQGTDVIIHQPMQPQEGPHVRLEWDTLHSNMSDAELDAAFARALAAVPERLGVSNHTGSLLTQQRAPMIRLLRQLKQADLFFLDSRTTAATVIPEVAREVGVLSLHRDVFLDHVATEAAVARAFERALLIARRRGSAILVAHPYPVSLDFLERQLAALPQDINLVGLKALAAKRRAALALQPDQVALHISPGQ